MYQNTLLMATFVNQFLVFSLGTLCLIPTIVLFLQYKRTSISDFLLFSSLFFSVTIGTYAQIISASSNSLFFFQLHRWALIWTSFAFFLHGCRVRWSKTPAVIWYIGICWFSILFFLVFFFELMPQPTHARVLFIQMNSVPGYAYPLGAGLVTQGGNTIFSSSNYFLNVLYQLYGVIILLYAYIKLDPPFPTKRIILVKRLYILSWILLLMFVFGNLPWVYFFLGLSSASLNFLIVSSAFIIALIAIFIPESTLISQAQILRAQKLFNEVYHEDLQIVDKKRRTFLGITSLKEYIKNIPPDSLQTKKD